MSNKKCRGGDIDGEADTWEPRYGNDSRPWLLGFSKDIPTATSTTAKDTFVAYSSERPSAEGARRQQLRRILWDQAQREVTEDSNKSEELAPVQTHYNQNFIKDGFIPKPIKTDPELHRRFPLYGDEALSLWSERFPALPGATRATRPSHRFQRYAGFTTPVDLCLDDSIDLK